MKPSPLSEENGPRIGDLLRKIPFFACLTDKECSELRQTVEMKRFGKNEVILLEEQTSHYMYLVYSGKVKAVKIGEDGKEHILAIHEKGDFFGEMALLDGKTSPATVIAMEAADIGLMRKGDFEKHVFGHDKVLRAIIALLCSRLREAWSMLRILTSAGAEQRVRAMLGQLGSHYGEDGRDGTLIRTRLTHQDIAHYASVSRETVTRLLDKFTKAGEIEILSQRAILLKPGFFEKNRSL
jgi:CRP/FNR family transcriptional regulator, cyclic AMP receptor protein